MPWVCEVRARSRLSTRLPSTLTHLLWCYCSLWLGCQGRTSKLATSGNQRSLRSLNYLARSMCGAVLVCQRLEQPWSHQVVDRSIGMSCRPWFSRAFSFQVWSDSSSAESIVDRISVSSQTHVFLTHKDQVVAIVVELSVKLSQDILSI